MLFGGNPFPVWAVVLNAVKGFHQGMGKEYGLKFNGCFSIQGSMDAELCPCSEHFLSTIKIANFSRRPRMSCNHANQKGYIPGFI